MVNVVRWGWVVNLTSQMAVSGKSDLSDGKCDQMAVGGKSDLSEGSEW